MRRSVVVIFLISLLGVMLLAQTRGAKPTSTQKPSTQPPASSEVTNEVVDSFMRHTFGWSPDMKWQIQGIVPSEANGITEAHLIMTTPEGQQPLVLFITPDKRWAISGELVPFGADPYATTRLQLTSGTKGPAKGPADASLVIVEFSDLQCPHCKAAQPIIDRLLSDNPNARFIFENYPLPQHEWAFKAAEFANCVADQNQQAFWKFIQAVYEQQEQITVANADAKLSELATGAGANAQQAASCSAQPAARYRVQQSLDLGKDVGVTGTPTVFLNGRKISNVSGTPYEVLSAIAKFQAGAAAGK
jgi:protein-disulfide isomerase